MEFSEVSEDKSNYLIYIKTVKSIPIRVLSEVLKEVLLETTLHFDKSGIRILTMEKKHKTAFVYLKLDAPKFDDYYCPKTMSISISLVKLYKMLKSVNTNDIITLFITKDDEEKLGVKIENKEKKFSSISKIKLIDLNSEGLEIPSTTFENIFQIQCSDFQKFIRDLKDTSDFVDVYTKNSGNTFSMVAIGDETEQEIQIGETGNDKVTYIGNYELKFLHMFCKSSGMCPIVEILVKENHPLILIYSVADLGTIKLGLSPKITNF
jgi:proliferating cell nuclear antigen PCNA